MAVEQFSGGNQSARDKLNHLEDRLARIERMVGVDPFIQVNWAGAGVTIGLDINAVLARIPKTLPKSAMFPVRLYQDNGSGHDGDATTPCSFTYTVIDIFDKPVMMKQGGAVAATGYSPEWARPVGLTAVATLGMAYYDSEGALVLYLTNEIPDTQERSCP
jgi:hypothetical protein